MRAIKDLALKLGKDQEGRDKDGIIILYIGYVIMVILKY